jgi:hypothetical protein
MPVDDDLPALEAPEGAIEDSGDLPELDEDPAPDSE